MGISVRNSSRFFCIECQPMRRIRSYSFSDGRNERRLISYWTIKGATGGGVSGKKRGEGQRRGPGERKMKEEGAKGERRKKEGKSFIPCDDKGLSQSRLIACSSPLHPSFYPFAYQLRFVLRLRDPLLCSPSFCPPTWFNQEHSTLLRPNFPSFDISLLVSPSLFPREESTIWHYYQCASVHRRR